MNQDRVKSFYRFKHDMTKLIRNRLHSEGIHDNIPKTLELLGCSWEYLFKTLGPRPGPHYHLDHIYPLYGARNKEEKIKLQHYSNLQWLTGKTNMRKGRRISDDAHIIGSALLGYNTKQSVNTQELNIEQPIYIEVFDTGLIDLYIHLLGSKG